MSYLNAYYSHPLCETVYELFTNHPAAPVQFLNKATNQKIAAKAQQGIYFTAHMICYRHYTATDIFCVEVI